MPTPSFQRNGRTLWAVGGNGQEPNANIDLAIRVQTVLSLAEMSDRLKTTMLYDEKNRKITDASGKEIKPITYGTLPIS